MADDSSTTKKDAPTDEAAVASPPVESCDICQGFLNEDKFCPRCGYVKP